MHECQSEVIQLLRITGAVLMSVANEGYGEQERASGKHKLKEMRAQNYHQHYYYQFSMNKIWKLSVSMRVGEKSYCS